MALNLTEDSLPLLLLWAHTDHTDPTGFVRLALNLTDALRSFAPMAYTDLTNLTDFFLMALNLTELGRKVVGHVRVLRVLRFQEQRETSVRFNIRRANSVRSVGSV